MINFNSLIPPARITADQYEEQRPHRLSRFEVIAKAMIELTVCTADRPRKPRSFCRGLVYVEHVVHSDDETELTIIYKTPDNTLDQSTHVLTSENLIVASFENIDVPLEIGYFGASLGGSDVDRFIQSTYEGLLKAA